MKEYTDFVMLLDLNSEFRLRKDRPDLPKIIPQIGWYVGVDEVLMTVVQVTVCIDAHMPTVILKMNTLVSELADPVKHLLEKGWYRTPSKSS